MPALYDVTVRTPYGHKACCWRESTRYEFLPFLSTIPARRPRKSRFDGGDRNPTCWHTSESLHAHMTLHGYRGQVLATISCDGYERE